MDKGQTTRYSKDEQEVIKSTFGNNEELFYELRSLLLGFTDKLSVELSGQAIKVLKKFILPELTGDVPVKMQNDLYLSSLRGIGEMPPELATIQIRAVDVGAEYLERRFEVLSGGTDTGQKLEDFPKKGDKDAEQRLIDMIAYKVSVNYIEFCLSQIQEIANVIEETEEEIRKREIKNSSK